MKTMHVIARLPIGWDEFDAALSEIGQERYTDLICKRLPDEAYWCGDEILSPVDSGIEIDIDEIISDAAAEMLEMFGGDENWEG